MKLIFIFAITSAFSFATQARVIFSCEGTSKVMNPGAKTHLRLTQSPTKEFKLEKDGVEAHNQPNEEILSYEPKLDGLAEYIKCNPYDEKCKDKASKGKDKGFTDFGNLIGMAKSLEEDKDIPKDMPTNTNSLTKLKLSDVKSGKAYIFGEKGKVSKFGNMGVYEFYDKSGKILGRYIYAVEIMDCSNRERPSSQQPGAREEAQPSGAVR